MLLLCCSVPAGDWRARVHGNDSRTITNRLVELRLKNPGPVVAGPWLLAGDSQRTYSDTNGHAFFSNVLAGDYILTIHGSPVRTYPVSIFDTNGLVDFATFVGGTNTMQDFYTAAQVDALIVASGGSLDTNTVNTLAQDQLRAGTNVINAAQVNVGGTITLSNQSLVFRDAGGAIAATLNPGNGGLGIVPATGRIPIQNATLYGTVTYSIDGYAPAPGQVLTAVDQFGAAGWSNAPSVFRTVTATNYVGPGLGLTDVPGAQNGYDVRVYGADPSGSVASQAAIQAAIDDACVNPVKPVLIPAGRYIMGNSAPKRGYTAEHYFSSLVVWSNNVHIKGEGKGKTILSPGATYSYLRNFFGVPARRSVDIVSATSSGTTVTLTTATAHGLSPGQFVGVENLLPDGYNSVEHAQIEVLTTPTTTSFTYSRPTSDMVAATVQDASRVNLMNAYLTHTNLTIEGITFDMENRGLNLGVYDTTQIYNVFGEVRLIDCEFLNNLNNDGIDVQFGGDLIVQNCRASGNGGDALGTQQTITRLTASVFELSGQEGLELNENQVIMTDCIVRSNNNAGTINTYNLSATGCYFDSTNVSAHSFNIGNSFSVRHISFQNCVFKEAGNNPAYATFYVGPNDNLTVTTSDVRSSGKAFLYANQPDYINLSQNTLGVEVWDADTTDASVTINKGNDVLVDGNLFFEGFLNITNGTKRLRVRGNTFRDNVTLVGITNASFEGNIFASGAQLLATNLNNNTISGTVNGLLSLSGAISNSFFGNNWAAVPVSTGGDGYFGSRVSDTISNRFVQVGAVATFDVFNGNHYGTFNGLGSSLTNLPLVDHFLGGINSGEIGDHGWNLYGSSATHRAKFAAGRQGCWHFVTAATQGATAGAGSYYDTQAGSGVFDVDATGWRLKMVFKFDETTDVFHRLGFMNAGSVATTTNELAGVYLRFRSSTDTFFTFVARSAGVGPETTEVSTITADTGWHTLTIRSAAAGMYFSIDGETEKLVPSNIPTVGQLAWLAGTQTGTAKTIWMDYLEYSPQ